MNMEENTEPQNGISDLNKTHIKPLSSNDEKAPDSSDNNGQKPRNNKGKKRKRPKDSTAPRQPLTGNVEMNTIYNSKHTFITNRF